MKLKIGVEKDNSNSIRNTLSQTSNSYQIQSEADKVVHQAEQIKKEYETKLDDDDTEIDEIYVPNSGDREERKRQVENETDGHSENSKRAGGSQKIKKTGETENTEETEDAENTENTEITVIGTLSGDESYVEANIDGKPKNKYSGEETTV
eukprot:GHVL01022824.1.p1 GENE.GHVL01022824.1~~GHVL01022824.1.p1  ORF type:complete len:151 (+),score=48.01 GHVL01022824.1:297-749(+)